MIAATTNGWCQVSQGWHASPSAVRKFNDCTSTMMLTPDARTDINVAA
jgi:hypothetical protein